MSAVCIIPARGGSTRLPRKNIRPFFGLPIIAYSIDAAKRSAIFDEVIVSTDDDEMAEVTQRYGADIWKRPADDGERGTNEVAAEVLRTIPQAIFAAVVYPCAPLLNAVHLLDMQSLFRKQPAEFVIASYPDGLRDAGAAYYGLAAAFVAGRPMMIGLPNCLTYRLSQALDVNTQSDWDELERKFAKLYGLEVL